MTATIEEPPVDPVLERVKTGVEAFDDLVMGGLPRGRTTIVGGTPGSGKTVFATQFLAHGITALAEPGVFVTFEESPGEIEVNMASFGWDLRRWREANKLAFVDASPRDTDQVVVGDFDLAGLLRASCMPPGARRPSGSCSIQSRSSSIISSTTRL